MGEGASLGNLGLAYDSLGEYRKAIEYHEQSLEISREIGDRSGEGTSLGNLGLAYDSLGEYRKAIEYHEQYLEISREIGDRLVKASLGNWDCLRQLENIEKRLNITSNLEIPEIGTVWVKASLGNLGLLTTT